MTVCGKVRETTGFTYNAMKLPDIQQICEIVSETARDELVTRFQHVSFYYKPDGSLLTEADISMEQTLRTILTQKWPDIDFLSEEMPAETQARKLSTRGPLWCVDPLDGTSNFAAGLPLYSVSVALLFDGVAKLGVIYDPSRDECFSAVSGEGAKLNGEPFTSVTSTSPSLNQAVGIVDFKRLPPSLAAWLIRQPPYHSQRNLGSCALEWCWLAMGRGHFYIHGGMKLWDYAAGNLILQETSGQSVTLEGKPLYGADTLPRSVVAARDVSLFMTLLDALKIPGR